MSKKIPFMPMSLSPLTIGTSHNRNIAVKGLEKDRLIEWMVLAHLPLLTHSYSHFCCFLARLKYSIIPSFLMPEIPIFILLLISNN